MERQMPSDDFDFVDSGNNLMQELVATEELYDTYRERVTVRHGRSRRKKSGASLQRAVSQFQSDLMCAKIQSDWNALFPSLRINDLVRILDQSSNKNDFIDKMIERSCRPRFKPKVKLSYEDDSTFTSTNTLMSRMDQKLNSGEVLGISYYSSTLKDKYDSSTGGHASLVVARRFNSSTGSCEYMVRNSWGSGCFSYDSKLDCDKGNIWIPEEYMRETLRGITYAH